MNAPASPAPDRSGWERIWGRSMDANPVLTRELLVAARSPLYVRSVVVAPLLVGAVVLWAQFSLRGGHLRQHDGSGLFSMYFALLAFAMGVLGATIGSTVIVQERERGALDAIKLTSLGIRRIVLAKFAAVMLGEAMVILCTLPVLAFILSLGGVTASGCGVGMAVALASGVLTASIGVAASAWAPNSRRALVVSLLVSGVLGVSITTWMTWASSYVRWESNGSHQLARAYSEAPWSADSIAALWLFPVFFGASALGLAYAMATSGLMDSSEDRGLPLKRWTLGTLGLGAMAVAVCGSLARDGERGVIGAVWTYGVATLVMALILAFAGEPVVATRRMDAQARSVLARVLFPRCLAPSLLFVLAAGGAALLAAPLLTGAFQASGGRALAFDQESLAWGVLLVLAAFGGVVGTLSALLGSGRGRVAGLLAVLGFVFEAARADGDPWCIRRLDGLCRPWRASGIWAWTASGANGPFFAWGAAAIASLAVMWIVVRVRSSHGPIHLRAERGRG